MGKMRFLPSEVIQDPAGRQYHIGLKRGDVAPYILMCGDPARVHKAAKFMSSVSKEITNREFVTITGKYNGIPVSVMATGMGPDNTEIAVVELSHIVDNPTMIRVGSCSTLKKGTGVGLGDVIISTGAVRLENTSTNFVVEGYPAVANHEVVIALLEAAEKSKVGYCAGITATAPGFYGAQGRNTPFFKPRNKHLIEELIAMNVANLEMEASSLFTMATLAGFRAGTICAVFGEREAGKFIDPKNKVKAEMDALNVAFGAVENLHGMDKARGKKRHWVPAMGI